MRESFSNAEIGGGGAAPAAPAVLLTIAYGSQTGNAEALAKKANKELTASGFDVKVAEMDAVSMDDLAALENLLVITSTYGDGDPPDNAEVFVESLLEDGAPKLEKLNFLYLALVTPITPSSVKRQK